jgi:hypothetical protein
MEMIEKKEKQLRKQACEYLREGNKNPIKTKTEVVVAFLNSNMIHTSTGS